MDLSLTIIQVKLPLKIIGSGSLQLYVKTATIQLSITYRILNIIEAFKAWKTNNPPLDLDLYLFNWTNADEIRSGVKPIFQEVGPYRLQTFGNKTFLINNLINSMQS